MSAPATGVQNERTALAWQRTALSLMIASGLVLRLTIDELGPLALVAAGSAFSLALWVFLESRGRYRHDAGLHHRRRSRGGRAAAFLTFALVMLSGLQLAAVLAS